MTDAESGIDDITQFFNATRIQDRRQYDATFKCEAVANWLASAKSAEILALELGSKANRLYAWRNLLDAAGSRTGAATVLQSKLEAVQRENRQLRKQRDILGKRRAFSPKFRRALGPGVGDEVRPFHLEALCQSPGVPHCGY